MTTPPGDDRHADPFSSMARSLARILDAIAMVFTVGAILAVPMIFAISAWLIVILLRSLS